MLTAYHHPNLPKILFFCFLLAFLGLQGCERPPEPTPAPTPPPPTPISEKSVVIHDIAALAGPFAFTKTMDQIVATSGTPTSSDHMLQNIVDSFAEDSFVHSISGKTIQVTNRPLESTLKPQDLLDPNSPDGMIPVGLFNRFDLAPADGSNCGEYRIVYAKKSSGRLDRMTMIFEARVPNPDPSKGIAGCAPITDFWADRSGDMNVTQSVAELEKLYYQGISGVEPIVKAENYGLPMGQLRVNLFKTPNPAEVPWSLREFLVNFDQNGLAIFKPETVDDSPISFMFRDISGFPAGFTEADQDEFHNSFLGQPLCNLVNPDRANTNASAADIINGVRAGFASTFNDFESISQSDVDNPASNTDPKLLSVVQARLASMEDLTGISPEQLMNRAGTMTCGGCHQFSADKDLGNGATWPASLGFVHIDESGALSPLLTQFFIPKRVQIAQQFKENRAPFQQEAMPCPGEVTVSRSITITDVSKPRELNIYKNVDSVRDQIIQIIQAPEKQPEQSEKLKALLPELNEAIDSARKLERTRQGPYMPARTH